MKNIFLTLFILLFIFSCNQTKDYDSLEERIVGLLDSEKGEFAVAYKNLNTGETILINENEEFHAASTMKTPVMIEAFKKNNEGLISLDDSILIKNEFKSIVDGSIFKLSSFDDSDKKSYEKIGSYLTLKELIYDMITISSNFATNLVIDYVGTKEINNTMRSLGANNINVLRGVEDIKAFNNGMNNTTTAHDLLKIYENLAEGNVISSDISDEMINILKKKNKNINFYGFSLFKNNNLTGAILTPLQGYYKKDSKNNIPIFNLSTWYVKPESRGLPSIQHIHYVTNSLVNCFITNYTPKKEVVPILQSLGFKSMQSVTIKKYIPSYKSLFKNRHLNFKQVSGEDLDNKINLKIEISNLTNVLFFSIKFLSICKRKITR